MKLYFEDGKTQQQIAELTGLSQKQVSNIISNIPISNPNNDGDKRRQLSREDYTAIVRLILGGERQSVIAERFKVSQGRISQVWAGFRDRVYRLGVSAFPLNARFSGRSTS